jgi:hypothetical protein
MDAPIKSENGETQIAYWKILARDTFWTTLKRVIVYATLFALVFLSAAILIYPLGVRLFGPEFKLIALALGPFYVLLGALHGLTYGVTSALRRKMGEIEHGVDMIVNPLVSELVERIPLGDERIGISQARTFLQKKVDELTTAASPQFRALSPIKWLYTFSVRRSLNRLSQDFLKKLEEKGERAITKTSIENYAKEKLIGSVVDDLKRQVSLTHYGVLALSGLFLIGPFVLMLILKQVVPN